MFSSSTWLTFFLYCLDFYGEIDVSSLGRKTGKWIFHQLGCSQVQSICNLGNLAQVMQTNLPSLDDFWFRSDFWSYINLLPLREFGVLKKHMHTRRRTTFKPLGLKHAKDYCHEIYGDGWSSDAASDFNPSLLPQKTG
ncbi:hypothetical protein Lal_00010315 [Lupinus albus]|nr:hypothetical protein Lal_00010315 [Lupinus albus]